jgi:hypothetical protein
MAVGVIITVMAFGVALFDVIAVNVELVNVILFNVGASQ